MKPQIIRKSGKPEYAVIPYEEYLKLLNDAEMLADVSAFDSAKRAIEAGEEELIPAAVVDRLLDGENPVRVWREFRGITASELAKTCGVTAAAISQIEGGKRKSSVALLKKIATALDVELDLLITSPEETQAA